MIEFEDHLKSALARKPPPSGFARRVMEQAERLERQRVKRWQPWAAGCIAASLLVASIGIEQHRERIEAREARASIVQALAITSGKLHRIEQKLEGLNR